MLGSGGVLSQRNAVVSGRVPFTLSLPFRERELAHDNQSHQDDHCHRNRGEHCSNKRDFDAGVRVHIGHRCSWNSTCGVPVCAQCSAHSGLSDIRLNANGRALTYSPILKLPAVLLSKPRTVHRRADQELFILHVTISGAIKPDNAISGDDLVAQR